MIHLQRATGNRLARQVARADRDERRVPEGVEETILQARHRGRPLEAGVREPMESAFGVEFGDVRIHTDARAENLSQALNARAFTLGRDVFFGRGEYSPENDSGREVLAHELVHVLQAGGVGPAGGGDPGSGLVLSDPTDRTEVEAEGIAKRVTRHLSSRATSGEASVVDSDLQSGGILQRAPVRIPTPYLGSGGEWRSDSAVTMRPRGEVWAAGQKRSESDFPRGSAGTVQVKAGERSAVQIHLAVDVFIDNVLLNEEYSQYLYATWNVNVSREGAMTIDGNPAVAIGPPSGIAFGFYVQAANPSSGSDYVRINPSFQGPSGSGGISVGVGIQTATPSPALQHPFTLNLQVVGAEDPPITVTPLAERRHEVRFERPGQDTVSNEEVGRLHSWYNGLSRSLRTAIENSDTRVSLRGYASTTAGYASNLDLAGARVDSVSRLLRLVGGSRIDFDTRARGEFETPTPDRVESAEWRKVVITAYEPIESQTRTIR